MEVSLRGTFVLLNSAIKHVMKETRPRRNTTEWRTWLCIVSKSLYPVRFVDARIYV